MTEEELADCRWGIQYAAEYSTRYHRRRSTFLTNFDKLLTLVTVVAGASAFGDLVAGSPGWMAKTGTAFVTIISLVQVLLGIGPAGMNHAQWLKRWSRLLTATSLTPNPTKEQVRHWTEERAAIEEECVAELRALQIDCENAAARVHGIDGQQRYINKKQRLLIHFGTFQADFPRVAEPMTTLPSPPNNDPAVSADEIPAAT